MTLPQNVTKTNNSDVLQILEDVLAKLHAFVTNIVAMYRKNPFHNLEHASVSTTGFMQSYGMLPFGLLCSNLEYLIL